jgi:hypothetical protein
MLDPALTIAVPNHMVQVATTCSDGKIDQMIESGDRTAPWGGRCFDKCAPSDQTNVTSQCWIECFYNNVLGM